MITSANQLADKYDTFVDSFRKKLGKYGGERAMRTPRQRKQASEARYQAHNIQSALDAARALAEAARNGTLPRIHEKFKTMTAISEATSVRMGGGVGDYAEVYPDFDNYYDESKDAVAFRAWLDGGVGASEEEIEQRQKKLKLEQLLSEARGSRIDGFFPTPDDIIDRMFGEIHYSPGLMLEPSAGIGSIADRAVECGNEVICFEINYSLCEILELKGHTVVRDDFLACNAVQEFDYVLMNPPYEKNAAPLHVRHAYDFLKDGGELVAIMPGVAPTYGQSPKRALQEFDAWLHYDVSSFEWHDLPEGAFKNAFVSTGVNTVMLKICK